MRVSESIGYKNNRSPMHQFRSGLPHARHLRDCGSRSPASTRQRRPLLYPRLGFYVLRLRRGVPLVPALIYQLCPMVMPQPSAVNGPNPEGWCRPLDRAPPFGTLIDRKPIPVDREWTSQSLKSVSLADTQGHFAPAGACSSRHSAGPAGGAGQSRSSSPRF